MLSAAQLQKAASNKEEFIRMIPDQDTFWKQVGRDEVSFNELNFELLFSFLARNPEVLVPWFKTSLDFYQFFDQYIGISPDSQNWEPGSYQEQLVTYFLKHDDWFNAHMQAYDDLRRISKVILTSANLDDDEADKLVHEVVNKIISDEKHFLTIFHPLDGGGQRDLRYGVVYRVLENWELVKSDGISDLSDESLSQLKKKLWAAEIKYCFPALFEGAKLGNVQLIYDLIESIGEVVLRQDGVLSQTDYQKIRSQLDELILGLDSKFGKTREVLDLRNLAEELDKYGPVSQAQLLTDPRRPSSLYQSDADGHSPSIQPPSPGDDSAPNSASSTPPSSSPPKAKVQDQHGLDHQPASSPTMSAK